MHMLQVFAFPLHVHGLTVVRKAQHTLQAMLDQ